MDKTLGYELRCAPPLPWDAEYARDLGYAAANYLARGGPSALMTIQGGVFRPIGIGELVDPATGRGRHRAVDVSTEGYRVARSYMVRIGPRDLADEALLPALLEASGMTDVAFRERFGALS